MMELFGSFSEKSERVTSSSLEDMISASKGIFGFTFVKDGRLFIWGSNTEGQLGNGTRNDSFSPIDLSESFTLINGERILKAYLGSYHCVALTSGNRIFSWGSNNECQIGDGTNTDRLQPKEITSKFKLHEEEQIIDLFVGGFHSAILTSENRLFLWGYNNCGQLGTGDKTDRKEPIDITKKLNLYSDEKLVEVSLGHFHSSILTSRHRVLMWGSNTSNEIGIFTPEKNILFPTDVTKHFHLDNDDFIKLIRCGTLYSGALSTKGKVFLWGENNYGQLGDGTRILKCSPKDISERFQLENGEQIIDLHIRDYHSAVLTSKGRLYMWGLGGDGQLGNGFQNSFFPSHHKEVKLPLQPLEKVHMISLGRNYSAAFTTHGHFFVWGAQYYLAGQQLKSNKISHPTLMIDLKKGQ